MGTRCSRRRLVGAGLGGIGTLVAGGYAWGQYRRRHALRLYRLEAVNESDRPVTLEVTVTDETGRRSGTSTARLEPVSGDDETHLPGPWMKHAGEWRVDATREAYSLAVTAEEITARLEGSGWGTDCAHVSVVVTAAGTLEARVTPSDAC